MYNQTNYGGYGKRPLWQWILLYIIIGGIAYGLIYYFIYGKDGGYNYNTTASTTSTTTSQTVATTTNQPETKSPNPTKPQGIIVLNTSTNSSIGTYLVATNGMTLYQYSQDTSGVSNCSGQCATFWPPYTVSTSGSLAGGIGINGTISTITRADGKKQITYNGKPLYFWQGDSKSGDTTGQNVNGFFVAKP
jgi:predicted lipoprotein with Yx(FWY)xxD motif